VRKWKSRLLLAGAVLFVGAAILGTAFLWPTRDVEQECFDRIDVGMPYDDAERVLAEYGFKLTGGGVEHGEACMVFGRDEGKRTIVLEIRRDGRLSKGWGDGEPKKSPFDWLFEKLRGRSVTTRRQAAPI
jgi:hypothetical protein